MTTPTGSQPLASSGPATVPLTVDHFLALIRAGAFDRTPGQVELIHGRIVQMNPQGPQHADPIDVLAEWSIGAAAGRYTIRVQVPVAIPDLNSCPEPDIAWVTRRRYRDRYPTADEVHLLMEVSKTSRQFDRTEKQRLYAAAGIGEYWRIDVPSQSVEVYRDPADDHYRSLVTYDRGKSIRPKCLPEVALAVSDLFPGS